MARLEVHVPEVTAREPHIDSINTQPATRPQARSDANARAAHTCCKPPASLRPHSPNTARQNPAAQSHPPPLIPAYPNLHNPHKSHHRNLLVEAKPLVIASTDPTPLHLSSPAHLTINLASLSRKLICASSASTSTPVGQLVVQWLAEVRFRRRCRSRRRSRLPRAVGGGPAAAGSQASSLIRDKSCDAALEYM